MRGLNLKHVLVIGKIIEPMMKSMADGTIPKVLGNASSIDKITKDGVDYWVVVCQVKFATENEAKKFLELDQILDDVTKTIQK